MTSPLPFGLWALIAVLSPCDAAMSPWIHAFPAGNANSEDWWQDYLDLFRSGAWGEAEDLLRDHLESDPERAGFELPRLLMERADAYRASDDPLAQHLADGLLYEALEWTEQPSEGPWTVEWEQLHDLLLERLGRAEEALSLLDARLLSAPPLDPKDRSSLTELRFWICLRESGPDAAQEFVAGLRQEAGLLESCKARMDWDLALARAAPMDVQTVVARSENAFAAELTSFEICDRVWKSLSIGDPALEDLLFAYSTLLDRRPADSVIRYYRGTTRLYARDFSGARSDLEPCVEDPTLEARARYFLGRALLSTGEPLQAGEQFALVVERGAEYYQESILGLLDVGATLGRAQRHEDAKPWFERVIARDPLNEWAWLGLPLCYEGRDDVEGAERVYRQALNVLPEHPQLTNDLGLLLLGSGRTEEALALFERAMALGSVDATENLGVYWFHAMRSPQRAADFFARVLRSQPERIKSRVYRELSLRAMVPR